MLKKKIILYLLLIVSAIGETGKISLKLAIESSKNGEFELSNKYLEDYIAGEKEFLDYAYLVYGYNLLNLGKYNSAIEKFEIIIKRFPLSQYLKNSYLFLISAYLKTNNPDFALTQYKEFKNKSGENLEIKKQIGLRFLEKGIFYFKKRNYEEAEKNLNLILNEFEDEFLNLWSNYYIGLIEFEKNNFEKAKEYFGKVIENGKGDIYFDSILKIGDCYFNLGEYETAEKYYYQLKENDKFFQWAKFQIARIEKSRGNIEKSIEILNEIDYKEDNELKFNVLYAKANNYIFLEKWDEAEKILNDILNEYPQSDKIPEIYFKLGTLNFNKKDFDNSIIFFKKANLIGENSIKEKSLFFLGYIYYIKKDFNQAFNYWDELKNKFPESSFIPAISEKYKKMREILRK
jgi:tetratricopeptide (TPR) repeat protein